MLSDDAIERYARQIVLPEVGGRGQERLLAATVALELTAEDEPARATAVLGGLHLGVAGVGEIVIPGRAGAELAPALSARNPAARVVERAPTIDCAIRIGGPESGQAPLPVLIASAGPDEIVLASPRGRCTSCLRAACPALAAPSSWAPAVPPLLAPLLAAAALRELLGLAAENEEPRILVLGIANAGATMRAIPGRADCPDCRDGWTHPSPSDNPNDSSRRNSGS